MGFREYCKILCMESISFSLLTVSIPQSFPREGATSFLYSDTVDSELPCRSCPHLYILTSSQVPPPGRVCVGSSSCTSICGNGSRGAVSSVNCRECRSGISGTHGTWEPHALRSLVSLARPELVFRLQVENQWSSPLLGYRASCHPWTATSLR